MKSIISPFFIFCLGIVNRLKTWALIIICASILVGIPASIATYYLKMIDAEIPTYTLTTVINMDGKKGILPEKEFTPIGEMPSELIPSKIIGEEIELIENAKEGLYLLPLVTYTMKIAGVVFIITTILQIGIPSRKTLIAMRTTKFITIDNIAKAIGVGGHFKDVVKQDIIDIIEAMEGEVSKKKPRNKKKK